VIKSSIYFSIYYRRIRINFSKLSYIISQDPNDEYSQKYFHQILESRIWEIIVSNSNVNYTPPIVEAI